MDDMRRFGEDAEKLPAAEQQAYWRKLSAQGRLSNNRIWFGKPRHKGSSLQLEDAQGRCCW
jgi:hypothetical protein